MKLSPYITIRQFGVLTLESRYNTSGSLTHLPLHFHEDYQFILTENLLSEYLYLRSFHTPPVGSLLVLHPGEVHSARGIKDLAPDLPLKTFYVQPKMLQSFGLSDEDASISFPFFRLSTLQDPKLFHIFRHLYDTLDLPASALERDEQIQSAFAFLMQRHTESFLDRGKTSSETHPLERVRDYLHTNIEQNISLQDLAIHAGISPFHLCRAFCRRFGMPPHRYQTLIRVERARALLRQGLPAVQVAIEVGFADQAHLTRHFKVWVGATPGQYRTSQ